MRRVMLDATSDDRVVGVIAWMHTFSPAKMWIGALDALRKPLLHLHTQADRDLPWSIDRHGLHEPQPGRPRRPGVRLHPDPDAAAAPHRVGPRLRPGRAPAGRRVVARRHGRRRAAADAAGPLRRQHARRRGHRGRQGRGRDPPRRLGEHLRGQRPGRRGRRGRRRRRSTPWSRSTRTPTTSCPSCAAAASGTSRCATAPASRPACASSSRPAATRPSRRTSRTSAACASCPAWPCSG